MGRRPPCHRAVFVIDPTVARAEEKIGFGLPPHGAAEMSAVERERFEFVLAETPEPGARATGFARPRDHVAILEVERGKPPDAWIVDLSTLSDEQTPDRRRADSS